MRKIDFKKTIVAWVIIILLAIIIVNIDKIMPSKRTTIYRSAQETPLEATDNLRDSAKCFVDYGQAPNTTVFVYAYWCPHCQKMVPIVEELGKEGYKFYLAETSDDNAKDILSKCFSGIVGGSVPQFICPKTGKEQTGEMTKAQLKAFADKCV